MSTPLVAVITQVTVLARGRWLYDETATVVRIDDEGHGPFVVVAQDPETPDERGLRIDPDEWPALRQVIDRMVAECGKLNDATE